MSQKDAGQKRRTSSDNFSNAGPSKRRKSNYLERRAVSFYDVIKRPLNDRDISRLLIGEEDDSTQEELSNSHSEDGLEVDDAESDNQEETSDHEDRSSVILLDEASDHSHFLYR
ncbi:hypothetical protein EVAR_97228_1 [Eumeta japonica]|uniref:Uncharacterized protein n=1 Tax=Eumeta variegata TaxID=151549 RepID=A0A4C2A7T6_EUMVA|nr:hypothetical protein EVAR_97228_1 [Eumeta japonica]